MEPTLFPGGPGAAFVLGPHSATSPASAPGPLVPGHLDVKSDTAHSDPHRSGPSKPLSPLLCSVVGTVGWELRDSKEVSPLQISHIFLAAPAPVTA